MGKSILAKLGSDDDLISRLKLLKQYDGWRLLAEWIELNDIAKLKKDLEEKEYETIHDRNRDKDRLKVLRDVLNLPDDCIAKLSAPPDGGVPESDPYHRDIHSVRNAERQK